MDEKLKTYMNPKNYKRPGQWRKIPIKNLVEGIILIIILDAFIINLPFTWIFMSILIILSNIGIVFKCIKGINGDRVSIFLLLSIKLLLKRIFGKCNYRMKKVDREDVRTFTNRDSGRNGTKKAKKKATFLKKRE